MNLILFLLSCVTITHAYKILCVFPIPSRSHDMLSKGIVRALLKAGHEVTWVTPFEDNKPENNLTAVHVNDILKMMEGIDMTKYTNDLPLQIIQEFSVNMTRSTMKNEQLRQILLTQQFDAVVTEWFFSDIDAGYAAVLKVPWIVLCGTHMHSHFEYIVDDIRSVSTVPSLRSTLSMPMNFWERLTNTASTLLFTGMMWLNANKDAARYESYFSPLAQARGVDLAPYSVASLNVSILLVNSHPSIAPAQSLPPNVVNIGGYHISEGSPLPQNIQNLLNNSSQGVIYFSMGTVVKTSAIAKETIHELIRIFGSVKMTVLWKLDDAPKDLPKNVHVRKWWPQANILAHPNIRLFITHGGLLSTIEAVHYGVPLLAVPVFGDQPANALRAVQAGFARAVPFDTFAPKLEIALNDMLNNDSYYHRAKYLSKLFNKRPTPASNLISHYVEVAIESKGAYHLRSVTYLYKWYERWMLDQAALLAVTLYVLKKMMQILCCIFCEKKTKETVPKTKKKVKKN